MNIGSRIRKSASLNEGTFDAPIKFARADMAGASGALEKKDWSKAAKIYVKNALKRFKEKNPDMDDEKLKKRIFLGLSSTLGMNKDIKLDKVDVSKEETKDLRQAIQKELGIKSKVDKDAEKAKAEGFEKAPKMKVEESTFALGVYKNAGL